VRVRVRVCVCVCNAPCVSVQVLDYIRGPHVPPLAKQKLQELGVWKEFEEAEDDGMKISVDHIVPHDLGATE